MGLIAGDPSRWSSSTRKLQMNKLRQGHMTCQKSHTGKQPGLNTRCEFSALMLQASNQRHLTKAKIRHGLGVSLQLLVHQEGKALLTQRQISSEGARP